MDCVFCDRIEAGDYVGVDDAVVRFEPLNPVTPGHMLFVPKKHIRNAIADPWTAGAVLARTAQFASAFTNDANIITSIGADATQTVFHLHVHYVPRRRGDGLLLPWSNQNGGE